MDGPSGDLDRDTQSLQSVFDRGGRVPPGHWMFRGPLVYPLQPTRIELEGATLEYVSPRDDWQSGFAICSRGYRLPGRPRARGLRLDFGRTGQLLVPERGWTGARKGIGITDSDDVQVLNPRVVGPRRLLLPDNRLFSFQIHNSSDVLVRGGYVSIQNGVQGADGIHLTGTCRRVRVEGLETLSGDDGAALTHEEASHDGDVQEDVTFVDCRINNLGHSAVKGLILADKPGCIIRRWQFRNCDLVTQTAHSGSGGPVRLWADAGVIEDVTIEGGRLIAVIPPGGQIHEPVLSLRRVRRFALRGTVIEHYTRTVLQAQDCPGIVFAPASISRVVGLVVPRRDLALVELTRCAEPQVTLPAATQTGWPDQVRIRADGRNLSAAATGITPIRPVASAGMVDGPFRYPLDFEWTPRLAVSRAGTGRFQLDTPAAALKPGGRVREVLVDRLNGDDRTGDGSTARPFRTVARAWMLAPDGIDTIDVVVDAASLPPSRILWGAEGQCPEYATRLVRPPSLILRASDGGRLYIAACGMFRPADHHNAPPVWTPHGTGQGRAYTTPVERDASPLAMPYDLSPGALASNGGRPLAPRRGANAVDAAAQPGSAFVDPANGLLWFRPFDDRDMAGDLHVTKGSVGPDKAIGLNVSLGRDAVRGKTVYLHQVSVIGGSGGIRGINQSEGRGTAIVVLDEVEAFGQAENAIQSTGGYDLYVVGGAYGGAAADALNVHAGGEHQAAVEVMQTRIFAHGVDAASFCGLAGDGHNNAATLHEWCLGAYFDCRFAQSDGRVVGFIENSRGVVAGCTIGGSAADDAGGYRTMVSASGAAVLDLVECTLLPQVSGLRSPSMRAEPGARLRLQGTSKAALLAAGLTLDGAENIVEEGAGLATPGPLRLYNRLVKRSGVARLYVRGVWADAPWSATLVRAWNGTTVQGRDTTGRFVDVELALLAEPAPVLRLVHAPPGTRPWTVEVTLDAPVTPGTDMHGC